MVALSSRLNNDRVPTLWPRWPALWVGFSWLRCAVSQHWIERSVPNEDVRTVLRSSAQAGVVTYQVMTPNEDVRTAGVLTYKAEHRRGA